MSTLKYKIPLLADLQSFGSVEYYLMLEGYAKLVFEQFEYYHKGSYSNRYYIAGPNGRLLLSIPLQQSGGKNTPIRDLKIFNRDSWQVQHWRTLISAYRRSPWFEFYEEELKVMYSRKYKYLIDWNLEAFRMIENWLGRTWEMELTKSFETRDSVKNMVDERHRFVPSRIEESDSAGQILYPQVFEERLGFLPNLSILDLLFCEGENARKLLSSNRNF